MDDSIEAQTIELGKTGLRLPLMGLGAWSWGDRVMWGYGHGYTDTDIEEGFEASLAAGINFIDTAEAYGSGRSERLLGQFLKKTAEPVMVATKFMPFPWRLSSKTVVNALRRSLQRMQLEKIQLYQVHWPFPPLPVETWARGMIMAVEEGLTQAVGVSNYSADQMNRTAKVLAQKNIPLASNQVEYHLLNRSVERNGILQACRDLGATLIAYSPLAKGMLTGKYTPENPPPGLRGRTYGPQKLAAIQPLIHKMRDIGFHHGSKTPGQVALNWLICKGTLPIPGAKNLRQAQENAGALSWRLNDAEVAELDRLSEEL